MDSILTLSDKCERKVKATSVQFEIYQSLKTLHQEYLPEATFEILSHTGSEVGALTKDSDLRVMCKDGVLEYSLLLFVIALPNWRNILSSEANDCNHPLTILDLDSSIAEWTRILSEFYCNIPIPTFKPTFEEDETATILLNDLPEVNNQSNKEEDMIDFEQQPIICEICGSIFASEPQLKKHHYNVHPKSQHECNICKKAFPSKAKMKKHLLVHTNYKSIVCRFCNQQFKYKDNLVTHYLNYHSKDKSQSANICSECGLVFEHKRNLDRHVREIHTKAIVLFCNICDKTFTREYHLKRHKIKKHN